MPICHRVLFVTNGNLHFVLSCYLSCFIGLVTVEGPCQQSHLEDLSTGRHALGQYLGNKNSSVLPLLFYIMMYGELQEDIIYLVDCCLDIVVPPQMPTEKSFEKLVGKKKDKIIIYFRICFIAVRF